MGDVGLFNKLGLCRSGLFDCRGRRRGFCRSRHRKQQKGSGRKRRVDDLLNSGEHSLRQSGGRCIDCGLQFITFAGNHVRHQLQ